MNDAKFGDEIDNAEIVMILYNLLIIIYVFEYLLNS